MPARPGDKKGGVEMAGSLQDTPSGVRLHIGVFGAVNSGKSSFINAFTGQQVSIVAGEPGTTTDPVVKALEISPLGACVFTDTAGFYDQGALGGARMEKTRLAAEKTDVAVLIVSAEREADDPLAEEFRLFRFFRGKNTPVLWVIGKTDLPCNPRALAAKILKETGEEPLLVSAKTGAGMDLVKNALVRKMPEDFDARQITGSLVAKEDSVLLVMPQDIQAPKGRLILPQVQTIRELLDKHCMVMCVTTEQLTAALDALKEPPKLIVTDSQAFRFVCEHKPKESMLTSFSVLFAAYKGDLAYYIKSAEQIDRLGPKSNVLIAECCTHAPLTEDIGRVKIPRMLRKRYGESLSVTVASGTDFPEDLSRYDLIIQCGACMFNRKYVLSRIHAAKMQQVPMTNYGVAIAHLTGILSRISVPEGE